MAPSKKIKYDSLNTLKGFACIGVILMHCVFPGIFGKAIQYLFKFSVPIFFMISGFFLTGTDSEDERRKIRRQISKLLRMLLFSFCFYGVVTLLMNTFCTEDFSASAWLSYIFRPSILPRKILIGTFFNGTMWYLYSLIWAYVFFGLLIHRYSIRQVLWLAPVLWGLHILLRIYVKDQDFEWYDAAYFRSFLLYSIPFILSGYWVSVNRQSILELKHDWVLLLAGVVGISFQFIEFSLFKQSLDFYLGTILYSFALFAWAIRHPFTKVNHTINYIGEHLSMPIYIIHVFVIRLLALADMSQWIRPFLAILFSIALAYAWITYRQRQNRQTVKCCADQ